MPCLQLSRLRASIGPCLGVLLALASSGCGGSPKPLHPPLLAAGGPSSRIEQRALSERPPLAVIEREGDPEAAIAFASLAAHAPELHAALGEVLRSRLTRAGYAAELVAHGLGFELMLLADRPGRGAAALLQALSQPITRADVSATGATKAPARSELSAVAQCSAEPVLGGAVGDAAELERERVATFARDRAAWSVVGNSKAAAAVADALADGPDWPELGPVPNRLPMRSVTEVLHGERASLAVALTVPDPNRALGAAAQLGAQASALSVRLAALGSGFKLRRVTATAHPHGACLRVDSDLDSSPIPEPRRLGFAIQLIEDEAARALAAASGENRLETSAVSAADPRTAARAAAYRALLRPTASFAPAQLVALTAVDDAPLAPSVQTAAARARVEAAPLDVKLRVESGQPGMWALVATPCAAALERAGDAGLAAILLRASAEAATRGACLESWIGADGVGLFGFVERAPGETDADAAARLGDALGHALVAPPSALDVASAQSELLQAYGNEPHPLLEALLEALAPGHLGALMPRGSATSLRSATREDVLARQRELLRLPHRLAALSPSTADDAGALVKSLRRWLESPDASHPSPCGTEVGPPAQSELGLSPGSEARDSSYLGFRIPSRSASEASLLVELLNQPGGALAQALSEPDLVGAARALLFGTSAARALVIQVSAFEGRQQEALTRVQKLFERLSAGGVLAPADIAAALARQKNARRLAAIDPRYRLLQLLDAAPPAPADAVALRRLTATLRPDSAMVARGTP